MSDAALGLPTPVADSVRKWLAWEVIIVLGVSLGRSAIYSILSIIEKSTRPEALNEQTTTMNSSVVLDRSWLDLMYQVAGVVLPLVPVLLVLYLLHLNPGSARKSIGFEATQPWRDLGKAALLLVGIGVPGLAIYYGAVQLGLNTVVAPANLAAHWWTVPTLLAAAAMNGILEEVIMLGYLLTRFRQFGWSAWVGVVVSAAIRASYHLYQGYGGAFGNFLMGLIFGALYLRWKRVMPLVIAHTLLDVFSFVGYALLKPYLPWL